MNQIQCNIQTIVCSLSSIRSPVAPGEYDLHAEVSRVLARDGIEYNHEYKLAPRCRIDFLAGRVGIEIKKGRPVPSLLKEQLTRYLRSEELDAIIVVSQQAVPLPRTIGGKPVELVSLNRLWGVALP